MELRATPAIGGQSNGTRFSIWEDGGNGQYGCGFGTERLTVLPGGDVGLGINSRAEKLAVNRNVWAREVKVENANWPDYVFEADYRLLSLPEIDSFITLTGIQSAADVEANGINLGSMTARFLKKIEELTLHLLLRTRNFQHNGN